MSHYSIVPPEPDPEDMQPAHGSQFRQVVGEDDESSYEVERLVDTLAANGGGELSPDLALDLLLNGIVEQARLATGASGAAIALIKDSEMVCRATSGPTAPDLGVPLDTKSGLSRACLETGHLQLCADTEIDPRVDPAASRQLGVRSILIFPLIESGRVLGVFEIFSARPNAFGERDVQTVEALSRRILRDRRRTSSHFSITEERKRTQSQASARAFAPAGYAPSSVQFEPPSSPRSAAGLEVPNVLASERKIDSPYLEETVDLATAILAVVVIAAGVGLGLLVGWRSGVIRAEQSNVRKTPAPAPRVSAKSAVEPSAATAPEAARSTNRGVAPKTNELLPAQPGRKSEPAGGLVVYEQGKEVFRMLPPDSQHRRQLAADRTPNNDVLELDANVANARLIHRVEPDYPATARANSIQGSAVVDVMVGLDGTVEAVSSVSGDPVLVDAAITAVRQWHYQPLVVNGRNTPFRTRVTLNFMPSAQ